MKFVVIYLLYDVYFKKYTFNIAKMLGFNEGDRLVKKTLHSSTQPVDIMRVRSIHVDCNIATGSYFKNQMAHTIYTFVVTVDPGYAIDEHPRNHIYLPLNVQKEITNITLTLNDQKGRPVNFRGEEIVVVLELKKNTI